MVLKGLNLLGVSRVSTSENLVHDLTSDTDQRQDAGDEVVDSIEEEIDTALQPEEDEEGCLVLDPKRSTRRYWTDPATKVQREIWRPGDGNGEKTVDYYGKPGPLPPLEKRWRFYQSKTGNGPIKRNMNEPPKYVILDDRAAYESVQSDIPRQYLKENWSHDFGGSGVLRARRPHRGREVVGDPEASGQDKYHYVTIGEKGNKYFFTGQPNYQAIIYRTDDERLAKEAFKPSRRGPPSPPPKQQIQSNRHGHNQFTPKDQMVKYGAPHKGTSWLRYRNRVNDFLPRDSSPPPNRKIGLSILNSKNPAEAMLLPSKSVAARRVDDEKEEESLWVDDGEPAPKRQKLGTAYAPLELGTDDETESGLAADRSRAATAKTGDTSGEEVKETQSPRRQKLAEEPDFFAQILAGQDDVTTPNAAPDSKVQDSGTYASRLEAELAEARKVITEQRERILELESIHQEEMMRLVDDL